MELRKLRHAVTLARFLNFTQAAKNLNITQSALSRSIQALERECRTHLFDRDRRGVVLTQSGHEFIRHAEALLRNDAALRAMVSQASQGMGGYVTLGVIPVAAHILLGPALSSRVGQPHFHSKVIIGSAQRILPMIMQESIDLGVCVTDPLMRNGSFSTAKLAELDFAIVVRTDHPLTRTKDFGVEDMESFPLIRSRRHSLDNGAPVVLGLGRKRPPAVTVEDFDALNEIVAMSDAVWITSPIAAKRSIEEGKVVALPIPWLPDAKISLVACWLSHRTLSPLAEAILEQFKTIGAGLSI